MVSFSAEKVGSVPLREISFCNVTTPSQLPGHLVVIDMPDNESAQVQSKIKSFIETSLDFNATLMDEVQRRSRAYAKAAPRWALDVWFRDKDAFKLAAFVAELWNAIESDSALIGVAKMERMRGGEFLLDCRGVAALQNPDIQANIDFALPVSSSKVVILTRTDVNEWNSILSKHNATAFAHGLPRVYRLVDGQGVGVAAPDARDDDMWTVASSVGSKRSLPGLAWPATGYSQFHQWSYQR